MKSANILNIESYNLTGQLPITRKQRRINERKNKRL